MAWVEPQYTKNQVDRAAQHLIAGPNSEDELVEALAIINNWRSSHSFPLNTFQVGLRRRARQVDNDVLVAQRIKRLSSIEAKLTRFRTMKLSQMQDIGGCRAVVRDVARVQDLVELHRTSALKHKLLRTDDYIATPQKSGYRGVHLIYRYNSDRSETYNGLQIEIQLRSQLQHAWATAVETVGTFLKQALKASQGHAEWLRFFALMSSVIAIREGTSLVTGTPSDEFELLRETQEKAVALDVVRRLGAYGDTLKALEEPGVVGGHYFLLALDPKADTITVRGYARADLERATRQYLEIERAIDASAGAEAVLVSVDSIAALKRAYPNYFLDTKAFLEAVRVALELRPAR